RCARSSRNKAASRWTKRTPTSRSLRSTSATSATCIENAEFRMTNDERHAKGAGCVSSLIRHSTFVIRHYMKLLACGVSLLVAGLANAGLEKYSSLVVADKESGERAPSNAVRVSYLGVNGFQFETSGHVLLVQPYFTWVGL